MAYVIKCSTNRTRHFHRRKRLKWLRCREAGGAMNRYQERGVSKGGIAHSLTLPLTSFAWAFNRQASAERACSGLPLLQLEQVRLIFNQKFSLIKTMTYVIFSRLASFQLTLQHENTPSIGSKKTRPFPPRPPALSVGRWGKKYSQLFERSKL